MVDSVIASSGRFTNQQEKFNYLTSQITQLVMTTPDEALEIAAYTKEIASGMKNDTAYARIIGIIGDIHRVLGNNETAITNFKDALLIYRKLEDASGEATMLTGLGNVFINMNKYNTAIQYNMKALQISDKMQDIHLKSRIYTTLGYIYQKQESLALSLEYFFKAARLYEEQSDTRGYAIVLNHIGNTYLSLDSADKALKYYTDAVSTGGDTTIVSIVALGNIGLIYYQQEAFFKAREYFQKLLDYSEKLNYKSGIATALHNLGDVEFELGNLKKAVDYFDKSLVVSKEIKSTEVVMENYRYLSATYAMSGEFEKAYNYHRMFFLMHDSLQREHTDRELLEIQTRFETEKKEQQIKLQAVRLKQQRNRNFAIISGLLLMLILFITFYFVYRNRENKKKSRLLQELNNYMQKAFSQQMNPHFIFNSLNSVQLYIGKNDKQACYNYLDMFSDLMRKMLNNFQHETVPLAEELEALKLYIELEILRFKNKFSYLLDIDENINIHEYKIPPMLFQPFVENAILHGLNHKEGEGLLQIQLSLKNGLIHCVIEDNGIGREKAGEIKKSRKSHSKSLGIEITRKRLDLINRLKKINMHLEFEDLKTPEGKPAGTKVMLFFPVMV